MSEYTRVGLRRIQAIALAALLVTDACHQHATPATAATPEASLPPTTMPTPLRVRPSESISAPSGSASAPIGGSEPVISLNIVIPTDIRLPLHAIADVGGYSLIVPAEVNRKITITLDSVPVSVALKAVLAAGGLTLAASQPKAAPLPFDTTLVFYQLPVNVDSLSADAIMKRFGVSREIADLLVLARRKP